MTLRLQIDDEATYQIMVVGKLDAARIEYFNAETRELAAINWYTGLTVVVPDQAALIGLLRQLYNLKLPLLQLTLVQTSAI